MLSRRQARRGLSLFEVIVAMAVFLISLIGLTYILNISGNMAIQARDRSHAAHLAHAKLAEVAAGAVPLEGQGDVPFEDEEDYLWSLTAEPGGAANLFNVTVTVKRQRPDGHTVEVSLSQMVLDPKTVGTLYDTPATIT